MRINREILHIAIPSILANITIPLVGMVDMGVAGHLNASSAALIGGISVGSMLFDLLYWNFGFLRVSTGGLTAQAYGRGDCRSCADTLVRSVGIALAIALCLLALQWVFVKAAFLCIKCSPEVAALATKYYFIRIWAAPATLSLMAFKGWFIGMQDSVSAMSVDLVVNGVNIVASILLSLGFFWAPQGWSGLGFAGVAWGTLAAQYSGMACALLIVFFKYEKSVLSQSGGLKEAFHGGENARFFSMNRDVFVRSLCFISIYVGFTLASARLGDVLLATSAIMMKLLMIFSYFIDGFAYAGEALTGKYLGAKDEKMVLKTIRWTFVWSAGIAVLFMFVYGFGGSPLFGLMTRDALVLEASKAYIPWLLLMPAVGCAAFMWDGIYFGATASVPVRNAMIVAAIAFLGIWLVGRGQFASLHLLMGAYFAHLLARTVYLSVNWRKHIFGTSQAR